MDHEQNEAPSTGLKEKSGMITSRKSAYIWGAASGVVLALFAPMLRPAARSTVKSGIKFGRYAKKVAENVKEEFQDIAAEAQADLNREENSTNGPAA
jgi:hypothetical protein